MFSSDDERSIVGICVQVSMGGVGDNIVDI